MDINNISSDEISRFWSKVDIKEKDDCWIWTAGTVKGGYGLFGCQAHRIAYTLSVGPIPEGLEVLHKCDNPPCCNPNHLFTGTQQDNIKDMDSKGRRKSVENKYDSNLLERILVEYYETNISYRGIEIKYGVGRCTLYNLLNKERYRRDVKRPWN